MRRLIKKRYPLYANLGRIVQFELGNVVLQRQLVDLVEDREKQLHVDSPVGLVLRNAHVGDRFSVQTPDRYLLVKVLNITLPQAAVG